jgi:hypothetical protein
MKIAHTHNGEQVEADAMAPAQAVCPVCKGVLILRSRKTMDNGKRVYYWRHRGNNNPHCSARHHPIS